MKLLYNFAWIAENVSSKFDSVMYIVLLNLLPNLRLRIKFLKKILLYEWIFRFIFEDLFSYVKNIKKYKL